MDRRNRPRKNPQMRLGSRIDDDGRECLECGVYKPWSDYYPVKRPRSVRGHQSECKPCRRNLVRQYSLTNPEKKINAARRWREENPGKYQESQIRQSARQRGLDPDQVAAHFREHNGVCDICGGSPADGDRRTMRLCIDHDHQTGQFRGLLCTACNIALGRFKDDPKILSAAIDYLIRTTDN